MKDILRLESKFLNRAAIIGDLALRKFGNGIRSSVGAGAYSMSDGPSDPEYLRAKVDTLNTLDDWREEIGAVDTISLTAGWKTGSYRKYLEVRSRLLE